MSFFQVSFLSTKWNITFYRFIIYFSVCLKLLLSLSLKGVKLTENHQNKQIKEPLSVCLLQESNKYEWEIKLNVE